MAKTSKNRPSRRRPRTPAPLGLRLLFDALQTDEYREEHASTDAALYADVPAAFFTGPEALIPLVKRIADREFPVGEHASGGFGPGGDLKASECVIGIAVLPAFWAGVAVAWHAMTALKGGAE